MVVLDAFGLAGKRHTGNDGRSIGHVAATDPLARAISARELEVARCLQLPNQGTYPLRRDPGGFRSTAQYPISAFVPNHTVPCDRYFVHRTTRITGAAVERHRVGGGIRRHAGAIRWRRDGASRRARPHGQDQTSRASTRHETSSSGKSPIPVRSGEPAPPPWCAGPCHPDAREGCRGCTDGAVHPPTD